MLSSVVRTILGGEGKWMAITSFCEQVMSWKDYDRPYIAGRLPLGRRASVKIDLLPYKRAR